MTSSIPFDLYLRLSGGAAQPGLSGSNEPDPPRDGADDGARRLAWQRALEHAQDGGFAGWFGAAQAPVEAPRAPELSMARGASLQGLSASTHASAPTFGARAQAASPGAMPQVSPRAGDDRGTAAERGSRTREDVAADAVANDVAAPSGALLASELAQAWAVPVSLVSTAAEVLAAAATADEVRQLPVQMPGAPVTWLAMESPAPGAATPGEEVPAQDQDQDRASGERVARLPPRSGESEAVRLYAEWSGQGVRIWLGSDAGGQIPVAGLALQLQRLLAAQGERLLGLVCNGQSVWEEGDPMPAPTGLHDDASPQDARGAFPLPARIRGIPQPYSKEVP